MDLPHRPHRNDCLRGHRRSAPDGGGGRRGAAGQGRRHAAERRLAHVAQPLSRVIALADALSRPDRGSHTGAASDFLRCGVLLRAHRAVPRRAPAHRGGCRLRQGAAALPDAEDRHPPIHGRFVPGVSVCAHLYYHRICSKRIPALKSSSETAMVFPKERSV